MKEIKLPKHIIKELQKASDYVSKSNECIVKFENWVKENVDENFDFDTLRASSLGIDMELQNESLTDIEYGGEVKTEEIEEVLNYWFRNITHWIENITINN